MSDRSPTSRAASSFTATRLVAQGGVWVFVPTLQGRVFNGLVLGAGAAALACGLSQLGREPLGALAFGLFGAAFAWIGAYLRATACSGARIDAARRMIQLRRPALGLWPWEPVDAGLLRFDELHAIELRTRAVDSSGYRYRNAVLDLVVRGGPRLQLVSHPDEKLALDEARQLQQLLGVPLRDLVLVLKLPRLHGRLAVPLEQGARDARDPTARPGGIQTTDVGNGGRRAHACAAVA